MAAVGVRDERDDHHRACRPAEWINRRHSAQRLSVSIGAVLGFEDAAQAHATIEAGRLPRLSDGTVGRLVRRP